MKALTCLWIAGVALAQAGQVGAQGAQGLQRLLRAYPEQLAAAEANALRWRDGTLMPYDDGRRPEHAEERLDRPTLFLQMEEAYPRGAAGVPPALGADSGRVRYEPFFRKMYGGSRREVEANLVSVRWLPRTGHRVLRVTRINGVDRRLEAVSAELEALPEDLRRYVAKPAGGYHWRPVAGTSRSSTHAFGIAVDIEVSTSDYWRWSKGSAPAYRNRIPLEIVHIFERHGFIWGGKWSHFDTMHFEYRPELLAD